VTAGPSVTNALETASFKIPEAYRDRFLFVLTELKDASGKLISRSFYYPRVISRMEDPAFHKEYTTTPINWISLDKGPWLKPTVAKTSAKLSLTLISKQDKDAQNSVVKVKVTNTGKVPAFMTKLDITGTKRAMVASSNYEWLAPGESKEITTDVLWREPENKSSAIISVSAWNAPKAEVKL